MKILILLLTGLILSGCAVEPTPLPQWDLPQRDQAEVTETIPLPQLCEIEVVDGRGTWSDFCWQVLEAYESVAETNIVIAQENAKALRDTEREADALIEAGKLQQQLTIIHKDLLEQERQGRKLDRWFYRGVLVLGAIGAAL